MRTGINGKVTGKVCISRLCPAILLAGMLVLTGGCGSRATDADNMSDTTVAAGTESPGIGETSADGADATAGTETPATEKAPEAEPVAEATPEQSAASDEENTAGVVEENAADNGEEPARVTICMVGDILLHTPIEEASRRDDGTYDYSHIFSETSDLISEADIALVNEEVIIGGAELGVSGYPAFNASYEIGDALADAGFDVVLHATNHVLDKGAKGLMNCYDYWEANHPEIEVLGIHDSPEDQARISVLEVNGISIAILNYTYGTNGIPVPSDMPYAVDLLEESRVIEDLKSAEDMADFTIVCPHWGTEYRLTPDPYQEKWAKIFAENGADLVIGTHPHVIEPIEWCDETLVYYSLGNYVNWTSGTGPGTANRMVGGMAEVTLTRSEDGDVCIEDYGVTALVTDLRAGSDGVTVYRLSDYTPELADRNAIRSQDPSFSYEYCNSLCDEVWGELWQK